MLPPRSSFQKQTGNALFLILIAVALFAALSYAVTQTSRGSGTTSRETDTLGAGRVLDFAASVDSAVMRLMLVNNVTFENIYFNNSVALRADTNAINNFMPGSPADPTLYLFHASGGGVAPQIFPELGKVCSPCDTSAWQSGHFGIRWTNISGLGTTTGDGALIVKYLTDSVCTALNAKFGISGIPSATVTIASFTFGVAPTVVAAPAGAGAAAILGKQDFCVYNSEVNSGNEYFHIITVN